jgi:hypothetical protein
MLVRFWRVTWSYLKHGPSHFLMYTLGRFQAVRNFAVWFYRTRRPALKRSARLDHSDLEAIDVEHAAATLKNDGIFDQLQLKDSTLNELREYCYTKPCLGEGRREYPFRVEEKAVAETGYRQRFTIGRYQDCLQDCAAVQRLASDPLLLEIARNYLEAEPAFVGARIWWSFAAPENSLKETSNGQSFHYDIDGYRSLAFFFYLTDADTESGSHMCVRGSHKNKPFRHLVSLHKSRTDEEIESLYEDEQIHTVAGPAGRGFAEDTFCFHKGMRPKSRDRLLLQVRYGLRDYGTGKE